MRQNFLSEPRPLTVFDELVSTVAASRFSFEEETLLKTLWENGEECHLGEDPRFQPTRWGNWCLRDHKPANQELVTRLVQSWDGTDLQGMLASLDSHLKCWSIFDLADPRLHWDGARLRMVHLPIYAQDHPAGNCAQGWLPLWRSSQLSPESESPRPQYLRLRRPAKPNQFALYLDGPTDLGRVGTLFLCSDCESHSESFGWSGSRLGRNPDSLLGCLEGELFLKDLFHVLPELEGPPPDPALNSKRSPSQPKNGEKRRRATRPKTQDPALAHWVLDGAGGLYARVVRSPQSRDLFTEAGEVVRPGDYLSVPLGTDGLTFWADQERWRLEPPAPDRVSLFRASDREKSLFLKTRCLSRSSGRRWLIPPALRDQADPLTHTTGVSILTVDNGWSVLESAAGGASLPAELLDSLGLEGVPGKCLIELRGQPPVTIVSDEEGDSPAFLESAPPDLWVESPEGQSLQHPHLVIFYNDTRQSTPLHGEPPWRVQLTEAEVGAFEAVLVDEITGYSSDPLNFELLRDLPEATHPQVGWTDDAGSPLQIHNIAEPGQLPEGLSLLGPPCWPVEVHWADGHRLSGSHFALDRTGRLPWSKISASLRFPVTECKLILQFRGLASLEVAYTPRPAEQDWSTLNALKQSKFWGLRSMASLGQRWEHLIAPVLSAARLRAVQLSANVWELQHDGATSKHLWIGRLKDWHLAEAEVLAAGHLHVLLSDGINWGRMQSEARISIEECLTKADWRALQSLLLGEQVAP